MPAHADDRIALLRGPQAECQAAWIRLAIVSRGAVWTGRYNVQERRARSPQAWRADGARLGPEPATPSWLGDGRLLSWRWMGRREAQAVFSDRLATLSALGYQLVELGAAEPAEPDPLAELLQRQVQATRALWSTLRGPISELLDRWSVSPDAARATIDDWLAEPAVGPAPSSDRTAAEPPAAGPGPSLAELHGWAESSQPERRAQAARWAAGLGPYEVPARALEAALIRGGALARLLAPRLADEGLALLGPEALVRVAQRAPDLRVRRAVAGWAARLTG